jgi:hypothetical protein
LRLQPDDADDVASYCRAMEPHIITTTLPPPAPGARVAWPTPVPARSHSARSSWTGWTLATVASIWTAVALISVFSPDMIHGSEHQRMPVAAFSTWLWGFGASVAAFAAMGRLRGRFDRRPMWVTLFGTVVAIWTAATLVSIFGPTVDTGSDPTTIPMAALVAPIVAMLATVAAGTVVLAANSLAREPHEVR